MTQSPDPDALPAGARLHWYSIEKVLGQGGFAITYLARDTNLDQRVAIKEYFPVEVALRSREPGGAAGAGVRPRSQEQRGRYEWGLERFLSEARILAQFDHPNIVRVLSVFEENGTAYMVMRYETGTDLGTLLQQRRTLPEREILDFLLPVLDGLELVHRAHFIHRDIKPENLYIRTDRSPVLLDFGSARQSLGEPRTVTVLVAQGYTPFEQYYGEPETLGPWTDIYSLGATCYRAISGMTPVDAIARAKGVLGSPQDSLIPARTIGQGRYSEGLLAAIDHAMSFAEGRRPQSISDWRKELLGAAPPAFATGGACAEPGATVATRPADATALPGGREDARTSGTPSRFAPALWAVLGGGVVAAVVVTLVLLGVLHPAGPPEQAAPAPAQEPMPGKVERRIEPADASPEHKGDRAVAPNPAATVPNPAASALPARAGRPAPAPAPAPTIIARPTVAPPSEPAPASPATSNVVEPGPGVPQPVTAPPQPVAPPLVRVPAEPSRANSPATDDATLALRGDAPALMREGDRYARGFTASGRVEHLQAFVYFRLAQLSGREEAGLRANEERGFLQPAEIRQGERLVEGIRAKFPRASPPKEEKP